MSRVEGDCHATLVVAGAPEAVQQASLAQITAQQLVEVPAPADVGVLGVGAHTPYSVDSVTNPVLAAWSGLANVFGSHTGTPFVRQGGALIIYHPLPAEFSPLHHPSYVDFFADVLTVTNDPKQISNDYEEKFAEIPGMSICTGRVRRSMVCIRCICGTRSRAAQEHCADVVWVGADRRAQRGWASGPLPRLRTPLR